MGKTCEPKAFSFQCMTEFTTNKKKKNKYELNEMKVVLLLFFLNSDLPRISRAVQ